MSLLLAGALGGLGSGLTERAKQQMEIEEAERKTQQLLMSELYKDKREQARLDAQDKRETARLDSQERIAQARIDQQMAQMREQFKIAEMRAGSSERIAQQRADAMIRAIAMRNEGATNKPTATQEKVGNGLMAAAIENGMTVPELQSLMTAKANGQFMTQEQAMAAMEAEQGGVLKPNSYGNFINANKPAIDSGLQVLRGSSNTNTEQRLNTKELRNQLEARQRNINSRLKTARGDAKAELEAELAEIGATLKNLGGNGLMAQPQGGGFDAVARDVESMQ